MQSKSYRVFLQRARANCRARRPQRGASLLEAIAYLGIAAIVVIGAVALMNGAFSSASTNELAEQVNAIQSGVKKLYMGQTGGYTGVTNSVLASAGVFPSTIPASGATATNAWGGSVTVSSSTAGQFAIAYTAVPQAVCINAVTAGGSWLSVTVNTSAAQTTVPLSPATAQTECNASTSNTITWTSS
jgi:hypothetical protein